MKLNHFTSWHFLQGIGRYGLTTGDVPTDLRRWKGRRGVWLTTADTAHGHGLGDSSAMGKSRCRLTVDIPESDPVLVKWTDWAPDHVTPETISALHATADRFDSWYIYFAAINPAAIETCVDMQTGTAVDSWLRQHTMKSLKRIRNRAKRCFELAFKVMLEEPGAEKFVLVHGCGPLGVPHAWIETGDGRIYDTTTDTYTPIAEYQCSVERRYTQVEMARACSETGHSGPWHHVIYGGDYDGGAKTEIGFLVERGEAGYDAYDAAEQFLGNFSDPAAHETPPPWYRLPSPAVEAGS